MNNIQKSILLLKEKQMNSFQKGIWVGIDVEAESQKKLFRIVKRYAPEQAKLSKPETYHVTVAYSRNPPKGVYVSKDDSYSGIVEDLLIWDSDEGKIVVAKLKSKGLSSYWKELKDTHNLAWDYPDYQPHITLMSLKDINEKDINKLKVHLVDTALIFQGEKAEELNPNKSDIC